MSRRDNAHNRCQHCAMHLSLCICDQIPTLVTATRLCVVMHRDEIRKPTNSGRLALRCLPHNELLVHGNLGETLPPPWLGSEPDSIIGGVLLYPCDEAEPLAAHHVAQGPLRLVVPDGTWRQAAKMTRRIDWIADMPRVSLPLGEQSSYRLRSEPKEGGLATMEAIARAFGVLEGPDVQAALEDIFRKMVDRTLYSRGQLARDQVYGGVPEDVERHLPAGP